MIMYRTHRLTFTAILHALMNKSAGGGSMRMRSALARMRLAFSSGRNSLILTTKTRGGQIQRSTYKAMKDKRRQVSQIV